MIHFFPLRCSLFSSSILISPPFWLVFFLPQDNFQLFYCTGNIARNRIVWLISWFTCICWQCNRSILNSSISTNRMVWVIEVVVSIATWIISQLNILHGQCTTFTTSALPTMEIIKFIFKCINHTESLNEIHAHRSIRHFVVHSIDYFF